VVTNKFTRFYICLTVADHNNKELKLSSLTKHVTELSMECNEMNEEKDIVLQKKEKLLTAMEKQVRKVLKQYILP